MMDLSKVVQCSIICALFAYTLAGNYNLIFKKFPAMMFQYVTED